MPNRSIIVLLLLATACSQPAAGEPQAAGATITGTLLAFDNGKPTAPTDAWVYLEEVHPKHSKVLPGATWPLQRISQKDEEFVPHVLVVPAGATVAFPNLDNKLHNVFSPTDPPGDLGRYKHDEKGKTHKFDYSDEKEYDLYCDIHSAMSAKIKVVSTVWFAPVDASGHFTIDKVPAGHYKAVAWMPDSTEVRSEPFDVKAGERHALGDQELHLQKGRPTPSHRRKDGSPYCPYHECL